MTQLHPRWLLTVALALTSASFPNRASAAQSVTARAASAAPADSVYERIVRRAIRRGMPGMQAYVAIGTTEWRTAAGLSSVENERPMSLNDRLRLASLTKMFTYAAIMELVKRGDLRLTDRAVDLLPDDVLMGVPHSADITVAQLIDHTSGLHNYNGVNGQRFFAALFADSGRSRRWTPRELIAFARDPGHPPTGRPGERRSYSSTGFAVAELIIEQRLRMSYARAMRALIFDPLGMTRTAIEGQDLDGSSIADSYARRSPQDVLSPSPFGERKNLRRDRLVNLSRDLTQYTGWAGAAGAAASNVDDLARFMTAVRSGRFIVLADQEKELAAVRSRPDAFLAWNGGSWGIQTTILYDPGRDIVIIVLGNASNVGVSVPDVARELLTAARGRQSS